MKCHQKTAIFDTEMYHILTQLDVNDLAILQAAHKAKYQDLSVAMIDIMDTATQNSEEYQILWRERRLLKLKLQALDKIVAENAQGSSQRSVPQAGAHNFCTIAPNEFTSKLQTGRGSPVPGPIPSSVICLESSQVADDHRDDISLIENIINSSDDPFPVTTNAPAQHSTVILSDNDDDIFDSAELLDDVDFSDYAALFEASQPQANNELDSDIFADLFAESHTEKAFKTSVSEYVDLTMEAPQSNPIIERAPCPPSPPMIQPQPAFRWASQVSSKLHDTFELSSFRINQLEIINATLSGKDCFVLMVCKN